MDTSSRKKRRFTATGAALAMLAAAMFVATPAMAAHGGASSISGCAVNGEVDLTVVLTPTSDPAELTYTWTGGPWHFIEREGDEGLDVVTYVAEFDNFAAVIGWQSSYAGFTVERRFFAVTAGDAKSGSMLCRVTVVYAEAPKNFGKSDKTADPKERNREAVSGEDPRESKKS
jgi:hypothetical protein